MFANKSVLILGTVWPEPRSSAAGSRMMQLIEFFQSNGIEVTFACSASNLEYSEDLKQLGVATEPIKPNDSSFDIFIKELDPHFVLFDRFMTEEQFGWRVAENCPNAIRILDTEDLHCLRYGRHKALKQGREFILKDLYSDEARREIASIYRSDLSLIISEFEMGLLTDFFKVDKSILHYVPFMMNSVTDEDQDKLPGFKERAHFISIGNFLHEPNWDAVRYLKEKVWGMIREELPRAELHIYGAYTSQKVEQLHNKSEGFLVKGRAEDARDVIKQAKILLAPLRFGAGLKGKLMDAMKYGTPSVTSDIGAEGMHSDSEWPGFVENKPERYAEKAIKLYKDQSEWERKQKIGFKIFNSLFDKAKISEKFANQISQIEEDLEKHRQNNFIGSLLSRNTIQGYKYMSKWIEEKNKNL